MDHQNKTIGNWIVAGALALAFTLSAVLGQAAFVFAVVAISCLGALVARDQFLLAGGGLLLGLAAGFVLIGTQESLLFLLVLVGLAGVVLGWCLRRGIMLTVTLLSVAFCLAFSLAGSLALTAYQQTGTVSIDAMMIPINAALDEMAQLQIAQASEAAQDQTAGQTLNDAVQETQQMVTQMVSGLKTVLRQYFVGYLLYLSQLLALLSLLLARAFGRLLGRDLFGAGLADSFRMSREGGILFGGFLLVSLFWMDGIGAVVVQSFVLIFLVPFAFEGFCLTRYFVRARRVNIGIQVLLYVLLLFLDAAYFLAVLGVFDAVRNMRNLDAAV